MDNSYSLAEAATMKPQPEVGVDGTAANVTWPEEKKKRYDDWCKRLEEEVDKQRRLREQREREEWHQRLLDAEEALRKASEERNKRSCDATDGENVCAKRQKPSVENTTCGDDGGVAHVDACPRGPRVHESTGSTSPR